MARKVLQIGPPKSASVIHRGAPPSTVSNEAGAGKTLRPHRGVSPSRDILKTDGPETRVLLARRETVASASRMPAEPAPMSRCTEQGRRGKSAPLPTCRHRAILPGSTGRSRQTWDERPSRRLTTTLLPPRQHPPSALRNTTHHQPPPIAMSPPSPAPGVWRDAELCLPCSEPNHPSDRWSHSRRTNSIRMCHFRLM